jgi:hypothetical protein
MTEPSSAPSAPSSEPLTGRAAEEHKHGYKPMPTQDGAPPKAKPKREFASAAEAGRDLVGQRQRLQQTEKPIDEIAYRNPDGTKADPSETVSLARAAADRGAWLEAHAQAVDGLDKMDVADSVDALRTENADAINGHSGQPTEPSQPQLEQHDPAAQQFEQEAISAGVDPELAKVLRNPQARKALESEFEKVAQVQQEHSTQVQILQHFSQEAFRAIVPEIAGLPVDQIAPALNRLAQTNPQRAQAAVAALRRIGEAAAVHEQHQAQRAHTERQQFAANARIQDAQFEKMVGHQTPQQRQAVATEAVNYAAELGVDRATFVHLLQTSPIMRHSAFQKMMHDAAKYRLMQKSTKASPTHAVPPVQRPGHTNQTRASRGGENLQALARKANSSGSLRDMANLLAQSRKERR